MIISQKMNETLKEELEVLQSIYPEEYQGHVDNDDSRCVTLLNEEKKWRIIFTITEEYPIKVDSLKIDIYQGHLRRNDLENVAFQIYQNHLGEVCMFSIIEEVRPLLEASDNVDAIEETMKEPCDFEEEEESEESISPIANSHLSIIHGPITIEMKSTFQSHLAEVHSMKDVDLFRSIVLSNRKIARATHNIFAYRFLDESKILHHGCDDDGETAAGGRVAEMMRLMEVQNVAVIITRWFGGILLGPNRFKYICNSAKDLLESCGYVDHRKAQELSQHLSSQEKSTNHKSVSKKKH